MQIHFIYIAQPMGESAHVHVIRRRSFPVGLFGKKSKWTATLEYTYLRFLPFSMQDRGSAEAGDDSVVKKMWLDDSICTSYF